MLAAPRAVLAADPFGVYAPLGNDPAAPIARDEWPRVPPPAQAVPLPQRLLTLADLTDLALRNNPATRAAWSAALAAAAGVGVAQSAYLPTLSASLGATRGRVITSFGGKAPPLTRYGPNVTLSYVLFDFGVRAGTLGAARYNRLAQALTHDRTLEDVTLAVEQSYYQLFAARRLRVAQAAALAQAKTTLDAARARQAAGTATVGDVYQAQTALAQAELALTSTDGQIRKLEGQLANAVGLPVGTQLALASWTPQAPAVKEQKQLDDWLRHAARHRPDLAAAQAQARAAYEQIRATRGAGLPSLQLTGGAGRTYFSPSEVPTANSYSIGLSVQIPLFAGYRDQYALAQARAQAQRADATRDQLYRRVELDVWNSYYDLETAQQAIAASKALEKSAAQALDVAQARYRAGVGDLLSLLSAQAARASADAQAVQAQLNWYLAFAALSYAAGGLQ